MKFWVKFLPVFVIICLTLPISVLARSGCCSHHGGVCGCGCCDGTPLSSTCAPYYPSCNSVPVIQKLYPTSTSKPVYPTKIPTKTPIKVPTRKTPSPTSYLNTLKTDNRSNNNSDGNGSVAGGLALASGGYMGYKYLVKRKSR